MDNTRGVDKLKVLMIGMNESFVAAFSRSNAAIVYDLYVLEEKEIYDSSQHEYQYPIIKSVRFCAYQQSTECIRACIDWHNDIGFDVVVPGKEYGVPGAYGIADALGLLNTGKFAVEVCTNKLTMRKMCVELGMLTPRYSRVKTADEICNFFEGRPLVLKPANRHASLGVIRISSLNDVQEAWIEATSADEKNRAVKERILHWEYLVEEYIEGYEVSVETLVREKEVVFHNITLKETTNGKYFVELKHIAPAPLKNGDKLSIISAVELFLDGIVAETGLFHSEWKISSDGPYMLECAARFPGDRIPVLIESAYNINLADAWVQLLSGNEFPCPEKAINVAATQFFIAGTGQLKKIDGLDYVRCHPNVIEWDINIEPGSQVPEVKDSMSRPGFVVAKAKSLGELTETLDDIMTKVQFVTDAKEVQEVE